jgi:hypothetical protein
VREHVQIKKQKKKKNKGSNPTLKEMIDASIKIQRWFRKAKIVHRWCSIAKQYSVLASAQPIKQRNATIKEIVQSEEAYVRSLNLIIAVCSRGRISLSLSLCLFSTEQPALYLST